MNISMFVENILKNTWCRRKDIYSDKNIFIVPDMKLRRKVFVFVFIPNYKDIIKFVQPINMEL